MILRWIGLVWMLFLSSSAQLMTSDYRQCPKLSPRSTPPKSVRDLRPDDLGVIMALGDSFMAGLNSRFPINVDTQTVKSTKHNEFRGTSFVMGGDRDVSSVARMLMHYNPSLAGASRGNTSFIFCYGPICPAGTPFLPFEPESTGLNAAQSGSWTNEHNTENQFKYLDTYYPAFVPKSSPDPWKLIFVEFGFNNICLGCVKWANKTEFSADHYEKHMRFVIEGLRMRFSKAFVVFMSPFNMSQLHPMVQGFGQCKAKQKTIVGCLCNGLPEELAQKTRLVMDELSLEYRKRLEKLAQEYQKRQYNDFTVVYDSGFAETEFKNASVDVISGADCFHPSVNAHNRAGISMWNNLFRAQKMKMEVRRPGKVFCPDELSRLWSP